MEEPLAQVMEEESNRITTAIFRSITEKQCPKTGKSTNDNSGKKERWEATLPINLKIDKQVSRDKTFQNDKKFENQKNPGTHYDLTR